MIYDLASFPNVKFDIKIKSRIILDTEDTCGGRSPHPVVFAFSVRPKRESNATRH